MTRRIFIGFDPREAAAFAVARQSIRGRLSRFRHIEGLVLSRLREQGLYYRPTETRDGRLWDCISEAPMSTEFAITRFLVPRLVANGWALFLDSDVLVRADLERLFDMADYTKAVMVVKHDYRPADGAKMDGQLQVSYARKNWSSVMLINCSHPANDALTVELVNTVPGRDLHRFCWLTDDLIGDLPMEWNWLAGHSDPAVDPKIVHHTLGSPCLPGYEDTPFAEEWRRELFEWAEKPSSTLWTSYPGCGTPSSALPQGHL